MFKKLSFVSVLISLLFISACGYRGALYLPEQEDNNQQPQQVEPSQQEVQ
ncbi:LPS translocon maturation chaperone LptM [Alteromonas ponticola]|uniref:Lipoprotein n=1 Tax=Alteromonas ponticola TaxID=2720613 RepID=A0ABX1R1F0_9ALTE|nr:lipoprotein [Alteromonas ponticola]